MKVQTENRKQKEIPESEEPVKEDIKEDDESDTEHSTERRYTWLDKNGEIASRKLTSYECRLEDDVQRLQDALFSISSHYAKIQFRLRQIASSTDCERLSLLRDLEKITRQGIDASKDNDELPSLLEDSQSFGDVRLKQKQIISQLRGGLSNLMNATDVCFSPEAECSYKTRKYQPRNGKSTEESTLEKGYLCEVWSDQQKPRMVMEDEDDDEESARPRDKRKSKSKKKRHRKSTKKNKKSHYKNENPFPSCILRNLMPDPLFLRSETTLSSRKTRSSRRTSKKRGQKALEAPSNFDEQNFDEQKKSNDDPQFNRKYNKTEGSDRYPENSSDPLVEMSPSFIDWTCGEPKCQDDCKCSITGNCIELKLNENMPTKKSKTKNVNFATPKDESNLQPNGRHSSLKSMKKALSLYFQGSPSSSRRKSASSTLVYPHAIGKPSNLCKTQSRATFRAGSSIKLSRCSSSDLSDLYLDDPQHIEEFQLWMGARNDFKVGLKHSLIGV